MDATKKQFLTINNNKLKYSAPKNIPKKKVIGDLVLNNISYYDNKNEKNLKIKESKSISEFNSLTSPNEEAAPIQEKKIKILPKPLKER